MHLKKNGLVFFLLSITVLLFLTTAPISTFAQDAQIPAETQNGSLPIPGTSAKTTTLTITVKSSQSNRYLGDVAVKIGNGTFKVSDPPAPGGLKINNVPTGQVEIVAERKFYMTFDQKFSIQDKKNNDVTISMNPQPGVARVENSSSYLNVSNSYLPSSFLNSSNYSNLPLSSSVINPQINLLASNGSTNNLTNLWLMMLANTSNPIFSNSGYQKSSYSYLGNQNLATILKNYSVKQHPSSGELYLVNMDDLDDARKITFVDRGDGLGGLAFIPAGTTLNSSFDLSSESKWLVTIYQVKNGALDLKKEYFYSTNLTPEEYARAVNSKIITSNILDK